LRAKLLREKETLRFLLAASLAPVAKKRVYFFTQKFLLKKPLRETVFLVGAGNGFLKPTIPLQSLVI